jgi:hypothetical protein
MNNNDMCEMVVILDDSEFEAMVSETRAKQAIQRANAAKLGHKNLKRKLAIKALWRSTKFDVSAMDVLTHRRYSLQVNASDESNAIEIFKTKMKANQNCSGKWYSPENFSESNFIVRPVSNY